MRIRDGKKSDPGSGMEKVRIRDQHPPRIRITNKLSVIIISDSVVDPDSMNRDSVSTYQSTEVSILSIFRLMVVIWQ
jgi:hypothetical protein